MKLLAATLLVTALWFVVAAVLQGCASHHTAQSPSRPDNVFANEFWMWEQRDGAVRLRDDATLPASHPLSRMVARS